ncbi:MAG TPA: hypothetical protein V6D26_11240 [Stenomitos sp.]
MASKKSKKTQETQSAPPFPKVTLVALKPVKKAEDKQPEPSPPTESVKPPTPVEPAVPVETPQSIESPTPVAATKKIPKPIKRSPTPPVELDASLPENSNAIFQAVGIILGEVAFNDKKASVTISGKEYPLFYASSHKKAFEALKIHLKNTGQSRQRLIVYPKIIHFPKREQPYLVGFQVVGFHRQLEESEAKLEDGNSRLSVDRELQDFEFKLSGLWQFIPVCQTPCITIQKNFTEERLSYIKEAPIEQKVNFMKASHVPVIWKDSPIRPFRFNPKLDKEQQGQASFVEIKAEFLPERDVFEFRELRSRPSMAPPRSLKAGKTQKAEALKAKTKRKREQQQTASKT